MAIYHLRLKEIGRGKGQSAVAASAYRHAACMENEATGQKHDYSNKRYVAHSEFSIPEHAPKWVQTLQQLPVHEASQKFWSFVEAENERVNARFANEIELALPLELTVEENIELTRTFIKDHLTARGLIADWALHNVEGNPHVHILMQTKPLTDTGFGKVLQPVMVDGEVKRNDKGAIEYSRFGIGKLDVVAIREAWAVVQNRALAMHGHDVRVDHRSLEEQGIELVPTEHIGVAANQISEKGGPSDRVSRHKMIEAINCDLVQANPEIILDKLAAQHSVFTDRDVARMVFKYTNSREEFNAVRLHIGASENLIAVSAPVYDPVTDKEVTPARYTTKAVFETEYAILERTGKLAANDTFYVPERKTVRAIVAFEAERGFSLTDEQKAIIRHSTSSSGVAVVVGYAGAGKSTVMNVVREAYEANGARVFGAALAGVAVDGLKESSGINSRTIASWEHNWQAGKRLLQAGDVFVVDEAGMVSSQQMKTIVEHVEGAGAKLILVGDHRQLQPIMSGAAFRGIADSVGYRELTGIIRQNVPYQREASLLLANGRTEEAIRLYDGKGNIETCGNHQEAVAKLIPEWGESWKAGNDALILAHRNDDVDLLNDAARQFIKGEGGLQDEFDIATSKGVKSFAVGDKIIFLEGDYETGIRNGTVGFIEDRDDKTGRLVIDLGADHAVEIDPMRYNAFSHGYAQTIHKSQGKTVDEAFVLASNTVDAHLTYVSLTRHRDNVRLFVPMDGFKDKDGFVQSVSRDRQKDVSFLYRRTQDYADALRGFMERRDIGTNGDWREAVHKTLSHWKARLDTVADRFRSIGQRLFPDRVIEAEAPKPKTTPDPKRAPASVQAEPRKRLPVLSEELSQAANRLVQKQDHARNAGTDRARKEVDTSSYRAFRENSSARQLTDFADELRAAIPLTVIVASGHSFDAGKLGTHYDRLTVDDKTQLETNWPSYHAIAVAAFAVSQTDMARTVATDLKDRGIEADYDKDVGNWRHPDKPLVPALTTYKETIEEVVNRRIGPHESLIEMRQAMQRSLGKSYVDPDAITASIVAHVAKNGEIASVITMAKNSPDSLGVLHGRKNIFGRADADRSNALAQINPALSSVEDYAERYVILKGDLRRSETEFRERMKTPIMDLSPAARQFMQAVQAEGRIPEQWEINPALPQAKREIHELANELQARFGSVEKGAQDNDRIQRLEQVIEPLQLSELKRDIETIKAVDQIATFHSRAVSIGHDRSQDLGMGHGMDIG